MSYRFGLFVRRRRGYDEEHSGFVSSTILGLLALLIGFTLAMAVARYDERKKLVLTEANAIGTAYLRADVLNEPYRTNIKRNLKQYVDVRTSFYYNNAEDNNFAEVMRKTAEIQKAFWAELIAATKQDHRPIVGLLMSEINSVIDISEERLYAGTNNIPELVYIIIFIVTAMGISSIAYCEGVAGKRTQFGVVILSLLFSLVIVLIQDLDRPRGGLIQVSQKSLLRLKQDLEGESH